MAHQLYFVQTELDVPGFLNLVYGRGGILLCEKGLLPDQEAAYDTAIHSMVYQSPKLSILDAEAAENPDAAVISLTLPAISSWEPRVYRAGRLYFPPDSSGAYDPVCLKLFRRIRTGMRKYCHYLPDTGHYMSDRLLMGCREGKWSAVYYHGAPIPISNQKESASKEAGDTT